MFATLSPKGVVAVHSMGEPFSASATQYLQTDGSHGFPFCLSWQPNDVRGALAVGLSQGIALWRRSRDDGWWCTWSLHGEPFACPTAAWSPDGRCLAAAGAHGTVRVWPHASLSPGQEAAWCVTLRRWWSGPVEDLQWGPDGTTLAVAHAGREQFIRLWDTQSWEISTHISLGQAAIGAPGCELSLAWCSNEAILGSAGGWLYELCGVGTSGCGWASGFEPMSRTLPMPRLKPAGAARGEAGQHAVREVAVCPRTRQRVAVRVEGASQVFVFERLGTEGWARQELVLRGLVGATCAGAAEAATEAAVPRALAFAGNATHRRQGDRFFEGSLLAVYWDFVGQGTSEVRTYPMHYLPYKLMHNDASVAFD